MAFSTRGCNLCLSIFDSPGALRAHRSTCQLSRNAPVSDRIKQLARIRDGLVDVEVELAGGFVGLWLEANAGRGFGVQDGRRRKRRLAGPLCEGLLGRYETTGIKPEHLRDAMPLKQAQRKIQELLTGGEPTWKIRSRGGKARILVGHGLHHDLDCLGLQYPAFLIRYEIQTGIQDPYEDCVSAMRLYVKMRSQKHDRDYSSGSGESRNSYPAWRQKELEKMTPEALLELSVSDYYCWCLDSN
ncbi:hypothetical protein ZIOFF_047467 [Zingiber officinale]|uniref:RNA exonuclease 4 n=1 Tax=Zingiber officinale TaxID=94328 RepID=A0A8J5FRJ1_ZINOF|nr:hypothetical protein ZIOFF_047467 [Zingiber officinale]